MKSCKLDALKVFVVGTTACFLFPYPSEAHARVKKRNPTRTVGSSTPLEQAIGVVDVYPFQDKEKSLSCTAVHVGDGLIVTSGHCFLGAWECNGASVRWPGSLEEARCTKVIFSNASEAYATGRELSNDLTVFKVDRVPNARLNFATRPVESETLNPSEALVYSAQYAGGKTLVSLANPCTLFTGRVTNIFAQPKPADTAIHNCEIRGIPDGSPIVDANSKALLAIHQSSSALPELESLAGTAANVNMIHYAKYLNDVDMLRIINSGGIPPSNIRLGGFAGEVFNMGLNEPLNLTLASIPARNGSATVSFMVHNGLDSSVLVEDKDGKKMIFAGPRRAGYEQRFQFKAPAKVTVISTGNGLAPSAWIEDIQSP